MNNLIITISGQSEVDEKNLAKIILSEYLNKKIDIDRFILIKNGRELSIIDSFENNSQIIIDYPNDIYDKLCDAYSFKIYTFSDAIKEICMQLFGLDRYQCYGSTSDKNTPTHLNWSDLFDCIRDKHKRPRRGAGGIREATGSMSSREILEVFENDLINTMDSSARGRSLFRMIEKEKYKFCIIVGPKHPNEITIGNEIGGKSIKVLNNYDKNNEMLPLGEFSLCIDNINSKKLKPKINEWLYERRLI